MCNQHRSHRIALSQLSVLVGTPQGEAGTGHFRKDVHAKIPYVGCTCDFDCRQSKHFTRLCKTSIFGDMHLDPADCKLERPRLYSVVHSAAYVRQENIFQMGKSWAHSSAYPRLESSELSVHSRHNNKMSRWCAANTKLV